MGYPRLRTTQIDQSMTNLSVIEQQFQNRILTESKRRKGALQISTPSVEMHLWIWVCVFLPGVNKAPLRIVCACKPMCTCMRRALEYGVSSPRLRGPLLPSFTFHQSLLSCWVPLLNTSRTHSCYPALHQTCSPLIWTTAMALPMVADTNDSFSTPMPAWSF